MQKPIKKRRSRKIAKPEKPYPDFPLFPHATRRWAKKILGRFHYFGQWDNPDAALKKYLDEKDDLHAGRVPRSRLQNGTTCRELANLFLNHKRTKLQREELSPRTFADLHLACKRIVDQFGAERPITDIRPQDFAEMEAAFPKSWGPIRRGREVQLVRGVFLFAENQDLIPTKVKFGDFQKPSRDVLRRHRAKARAKYGLRIFEANELRALIDGALVVGENGPKLVQPGEQLRCMILLAANTGIGNTDIAGLTVSALDLDEGWLNLARQKTGVERRCSLWPETIQTLRDVIANRPEPKDADDHGIVFLTRTRGRWLKLNFVDDADGKVTVSPYDAIGKEFRKLVKAMGLARKGRAFYSLRRNCETIGGESRDQVALDAIMGHVDSSMADKYRERISDERLRAVADFIRRWLFGDALNT
jgi:integrase